MLKNRLELLRVQNNYYNLVTYKASKEFKNIKVCERGQIHNVLFQSFVSLLTKFLGSGDKKLLEVGLYLDFFFFGVHTPQKLYCGLHEEEPTHFHVVFFKYLPVDYL